MHGAAYVQKPSGRLRRPVGDGGFIEIPPDLLLEFNNLVRASILYFIALQRPGRTPAADDSKREDVLAILDRAQFDLFQRSPGLRQDGQRILGFPG